MAKITINNIVVDPLAERPALSEAKLETNDAASSDYVLIQTRHPLDKQEKAQLAATGASILEYVPDSTYLCHFEPQDLTAVRKLPFVAWANVYLRQFKVPPALKM